ncbi:SMP-30/Gluconolaconase/LRE-like region family protein [Asticcacaulis biprosthecium C19]|uniref:SMP-30/Gluconolaconase/LRE-like region family protein n=1 Tax=Asticcacaulis biprosthecium C19 TaxID=715226 RepID=F4QKN0_9CAUL|nr:SMP-30/gluconolactonase/LRE family protein [Asticcacaulis biprosthecium]EGF93332.1 SMP-30/Gluconolaconase/LRE-like region family protein [Asticcacaulis biprosthecium C19]
MAELFQPICVWDRKCTLGEGPVWSARDHALWFVDIKRSEVLRYDVNIGSHQVFHAPSPCGFIAPKRSGGFIVGCKTGLYDLDPKTGHFEFRLQVEPGLPTNRLNDGFVDHHGRLWFGSMDDDEVNPTGKLYRYDARGLVAMDHDYVITNGPAVSPDGKTLYHNDTLKKIIYAFDLDGEGHISNKREFARLDAMGRTGEHGEGYMDGPLVDAQGNVWVGLFFGWGVNGYAPDGRLIRQVKFPVSNVTKIAFGGHDLKTVYATTAAKGLSADDLKHQPQAGGLFRFDVDIPGQPQNLFQD